eukprot:gb/GECH01008369.1/.p1 GENE.gb/GECH01008369.1/~~gb/GECH01008369.1/.p1  ORF type:complete len:459 (+),score=81.21 gb/GECH01008369.1/:1-1377(+)
MSQDNFRSIDNVNLNAIKTTQGIRLSELRKENSVLLGFLPTSTNPLVSTNISDIQSFADKIKRITSNLNITVVLVQKGPKPLINSLREYHSLPNVYEVMDPHLLWYSEFQFNHLVESDLTGRTRKGNSTSGSTTPGISATDNEPSNQINECVVLIKNTSYIPSNDPQDKNSKNENINNSKEDNKFHSIKTRSDSNSSTGTSPYQSVLESNPYTTEDAIQDLKQAISLSHVTYIFHHQVMEEEDRPEVELFDPIVNKCDSQPKSEDRRKSLRILKNMLVGCYGAAEGNDQDSEDSSNRTLTSASDWTLNEVMQDSERRRLFTEFCIKDLSVENILFLEAYEPLAKQFQEYFHTKQHGSSDKGDDQHQFQEISKEATKILNDFLKPNAGTEISVSAESVEDLMSAPFTSEDQDRQECIISINSESDLISLRNILYDINEEVAINLTDSLARFNNTPAAHM